MKLAALGAVLTASSLWAGLAADDFLPRHHPAPPAAPEPDVGAARHIPGSRAAIRRTRARSWITGCFRGLRIPPHASRSSRPLSAPTHMLLDYAAWPDAPWLMHAQSLAWYAWLAIVATGAVYRRFVGQYVGRGTRGSHSLRSTIRDKRAGSWLDRQSKLDHRPLARAPRSHPARPLATRRVGHGGLAGKRAPRSSATGRRIGPSPFVAYLARRTRITSRRARAARSRGDAFSRTSGFFSCGARRTPRSAMGSRVRGFTSIRVSIPLRVSCRSAEAASVLAPQESPSPGHAPISGRSTSSWGRRGCRG